MEGMPFRLVPLVSQACCRTLAGSVQERVGAVWEDTMH
jgi:hypothetical protein